MNATRPNPSLSKLLDRYERLSVDLKLVLRVKSLVFLPAGKTVFLECLTRTGFRDANRKLWSAGSLNPMLDELVRQGLLTEALACQPALLHPVAVDAVASAHGEALVAAVRKTFPAQSIAPYYAHGTFQPNRDALPRLIRLAIYANDAAGFVASRDLHDKACAPHRAADLLSLLFMAEALLPDWLASREPAIQLALFEAKLSAFLTSGIPGPDMTELIAHYRGRQEQEAFAAFRPALLQHDLLAGRLDDVQHGSLRLGDDAGGARLALDAAVAFLQGRNEAALAHYRDALKRQRKRLGKRRVFLDGVHGMFFLMALLRADDAGLRAEIQSGIDIALLRPSPYVGGFLALQALLWMAQGLQKQASELLAQLRHSMPDEPLSAACVALAEYAVDPEPKRVRRADLAARFEHLKDRLPLIARIQAEILATVAERPGPYVAYLADSQDIRVSFTRLVEIRQPWERALEGLDALLGGEVKPSVRKARRLAWFIDPQTQHVEVAEQSARGRDGWSDGRPIAMKRLHERDPRLDYLTEQDRAALRSLRHANAGWYGEDSYQFDTLRTIPALIGHPVLFDARSRAQPLELVRYPLELVVTERRGGYHVALTHTAEEPTLFLEAETPTRYRVVEFPQQLLPVQEILGPHGLTVPGSARDRLVALVRRNNPALPIRDEIGAIEQTALEGQPIPVIQCLPLRETPGEGLKFSLLVRPFGAEGPAYVAGIGARSVLAEVGGQPLRAKRDLQRELAERSAMIEACPTLRDRAGPDAHTHLHELVIEDMEGCLDLLLELQAYPGSISVEWPEGHRLQVGTVSPNRLKLRVGQDRDWFSVDGSVALDDEQVLEMRFLLERLDRAQGRFVPLGDGRFAALTHQMQAQLQRLASVGEPQRGGLRMHRLAAPVLDGLLEEAGEVEADAAWTRHVARLRKAEGWTPKLPPTLQAELRDYQVEGFTWLSRLARWGAGGCLADDMGLGKTVQAIAVMLDRAAQGPCLVVAPTSVCPNWETEIARFAPTLTTRHLASAPDRAAAIEGLGPGEVLVCSYGLLHQEAELLGSRPWQMVVLDEAQAIKNAATKRAQASVALKAELRVALTGTPVENYLDELWSLFNFINPGLLGSREGFQKRFAGPIERDGDPHARQALRALIRPFLLRRTKATVLNELPPRTEQTMQVEMTEAERAFYEALRQRALENIAALDDTGGRRKIHILAEITRLRRACCNPALIDPAAGVPSGKLEAFLELVDDLIRNRHRALVFSQFVGHLALVREALDARGIRYAYLDGSTPSAERQRRVASFQAGAADLFLISLRAGGTGLNLTAADYVVHLDPWWNPAVEDQASDRAHRIGQQRPVTIYRLIMQDSIEERILRLHRDKRDLASELLDGAEAAGRLSEEELLGLIRA